MVSVGRVGKRVVFQLEAAQSRPGDCIVLEPRMSGLVLLADPPDDEHLRLVFDLRGGQSRQLLFWDRRGLGVARLVSPRQFVRLFGPEKLGPDALEISLESLHDRLRSSGRPIKVALMDQRTIAGIGNLYASEILHRAAIHPGRACRKLRPAEWQKLYAAVQEILAEAIRHQGSTLRDGTYRIARNEPGRFQTCHRVYQRTGEQCLRCGRAAIVRIVQAQRSTFFCPSCQRK